MMKYVVLIHKDPDSGFWSECPQLPGCFSQGETLEELMENTKEAAKLYLQEGVKKADLDMDPVYEIRELVI